MLKTSAQSVKHMVLLKLIKLPRSPLKSLQNKTLGYGRTDHRRGGHTFWLSQPDKMCNTEVRQRVVTKRRWILVHYRSNHKPPEDNEGEQNSYVTKQLQLYN